MKKMTGTSRRNFLRGAGVALALPWLESLPVLAQDGKAPIAGAAANKPPLRFAHISFPTASNLLTGGRKAMAGTWNSAPGRNRSRRSVKN